MSNSVDPDETAHIWICAVCKSLLLSPVAVKVKESDCCSILPVTLKIYQPAGHIVTGNLKIITDSRIRSVISKGPKYRFPPHIDFNKCRETIASALNDYCSRWCKREHVESNALNNWKLKIFKIIDERVLFYSNNLDLLPPKPKLSFRYLKQGIQEFHRKYVLASADKAANNVVVVWRLYYINTLKQELGSTKTYERISTDERSIINTHSIDITAKFAVSIKEKQDILPTLYWLPKLHKRPYKARFIAISSSCTTTVLSKLLTSCLTAVKKHWVRYYDTVYERDGINYFWSIKNSNDVLNKFKSKNFQASKLSTYDFSTLYTTLPHHLIKDKLTDLINRTFIRENTNNWLATKNMFFSVLMYIIITIYGHVKKSVMPLFIFWIIFFIRFGTKRYRQTIGIPMGTNCAPLVADLFLFCYERDFMKSLSRENQADIIEAFNSTSRYLDDLLNIDNIYFDQMVDRIYPTELQLNRANSSDTEAPFFDLNPCISNGTFSKIYDKRDDFDFDIVNFPFLDGEVPRRTHMWYTYLNL